MSDWPGLDRFLAADPRDVGCEQALEILHVYVEYLRGKGVLGVQANSEKPLRLPAGFPSLPWPLMSGGSGWPDALIADMATSMASCAGRGSATALL